jgi:hypothetical protein
MLAGLASGQAIISGSYQGRQATIPASSAIGEVQWSGPVVITEAGTYSGNWQSTDPKTPAVTVATTAPVIIENSHIRSVADLIKAGVAGSDLTVRNSIGVAVNPAAKGLPNGIFLEVSSPARLDVENNYIENTRSGVLVHGYSGARDGNQTIVIRANRARNFNGLLSDGNGGYLPGNGSTRGLSHFLEFDNVQSVPGIDVGWNEVINYPGHSLLPILSTSTAQVERRTARWKSTTPTSKVHIPIRPQRVLMTVVESRRMAAPTIRRKAPPHSTAFTTIKSSER